MKLFYLIPYPKSFPNCDRSFFKREQVKAFTGNEKDAYYAGERYEMELNSGHLWGFEPTAAHVEVLSWWDAKQLFGKSMDEWECNQKRRWS